MKKTEGDWRAYTLKPHWAHAIAHLGKRCENRNTPIPKGLVGKRVAIHAGAWSGIERVAWLDEIDAAFPGSKAERRERCGGSLVPLYGPGLRGAGRSQPNLLRCSAFVATAVLSEQTPVEVYKTHHWQKWGHTKPWTPVRRIPYQIFWWRLEDVRVLACPVPVARGAQGPWRLTQGQVDAINAQGGGLE